MTIVLYLIILIASVKFQIIDGKRYYRLSETNRVKEVDKTPARGKILDRKGRVIATVRPGYEVRVLPAVIDQLTIKKLATILDINPGVIDAKIKRNRNPYQMIDVAHDIDLGTLSHLEEQLYQLRGVDVVTEPLRYYPYKDVFFHTIGYVGEASEADITKKSYSPGDFKGKTALEVLLEDQIKGQKGKDYIEINALGKEIGPVMEKRPIDPKRGENITTTLDVELQESTALYLKDYERAAAVGINLKSGGLLILYSKPGIDPNMIVHGVCQKDWDSIVQKDDAPLYNRATMSRYPPGSTFKILTAIAALSQGWDTSRTITCTGRFAFGNRIFRCWKKHGRVSFGEAIEKSCDTYFYTIGKELGLDPLVKTAHIFNLNDKTGIEIEEESGFFPDNDWYERRYGKNWPRGVVLNLSIGQGEVLLTPLGLATLYARVITGQRLKPHLLNNKQEVESLPIDTWILNFVRRGLVKVVEEGTGRIVSYYLQDAAGKTGTAQNPHGEDHSIFVGYTPIKSPEFLICVIVENAGHGASVAAPIAARIMSFYKRIYAQKG